MATVFGDALLRRFADGAEDGEHVEPQGGDGHDGGGLRAGRIGYDAQERGDERTARDTGY